jgi:hypothetical protein
MVRFIRKAFILITLDSLAERLPCDTDHVVVVAEKYGGKLSKRLEQTNVPRFRKITGRGIRNEHASWTTHGRLPDPSPDPAAARSFGQNVI